MRILLADSDRDLFQIYAELLTMDGHEVRTAFDGTQVALLADKEAFDIAILEENLPRVKHDTLLRMLEQKGVPVIVLPDGPVTVKRLLRSPLPNAYLPYPFMPADLRALMESVAEKAKAVGTIRRGGVEVDTAGFRFAGTGVRLTAGEMDMLSDLEDQKAVSGKEARILIQALNEKLAGMGGKTRVVYEIEKGYRLVNGND